MLNRVHISYYRESVNIYFSLHLVYLTIYVDL